MKIDKTEFYQTGFYSLIAMIIGFIIGSISFKGNKTEQITIPITLNDSINKDTIIRKNVALDTTKPTDKTVLSELKKQNISHPHIVLAQAKLESGNYKSNVCKRHNNLFGLMKGDNYHSFSHWKESIAYYKNHVQNRYKGGDYYAFLNNIGYAQDPNYINKLKELV